MFGWFRARRRRKIVAQPFSTPRLDVLRRDVGLYGWLNEEQQAFIRKCVAIMAAEIHWEGCNGLTISERIQVTISANAAVLLLGYMSGDYYFDRVETILVYPHTFVRRPRPQPGEVFDTRPSHRSGEAWHRGPIVLSWSDCLRDSLHPGTGHNVVLHEFAHHLDGLDGEMSGTPAIPARLLPTWKRVFDVEYERLVESVDWGQVTLLDPYGATSPAEFFAVVTECFFERPAAFRAGHAELYDLLVEYYGQDPHQWPGHVAT